MVQGELGTDQEERRVLGLSNENTGGPRVGLVGARSAPESSSDGEDGAEGT